MKKPDPAEPPDRRQFMKTVSAAGVGLAGSVSQPKPGGAARAPDTRSMKGKSYDHGYDACY